MKQTAQCSRQSSIVHCSFAFDFVQSNLTRFLNDRRRGALDMLLLACPFLLLSPAPLQPWTSKTPAALNNRTALSANLWAYHTWGTRRSHRTSHGPSLQGNGGTQQAQASKGQQAEGWTQRQAAADILRRRYSCRTHRQGNILRFTCVHTACACCKNGISCCLEGSALSPKRWCH